VTLYHLVLLLIFVVLIVAAVFLFAPTRRSQRVSDPPVRRQSTGPVARDDDRYWYGGFFYFNPDDPDVIVPKRFGLGFTVNIGHPLGKVFIVAMAILLLLPVALALFVPGFGSAVGPGCHPTSGCH